MKKLSFIARLVAALIMLQTLYFKFTAHPDSVYIFTRIGMEPWGRWVIGSAELVASILLFVPKLRWLGAVLGANLMIGALFFHVAILGIEVNNDGGTLFMLALATLICCSIELIINYRKIRLMLGSLTLKTPLQDQK